MGKIGTKPLKPSNFNATPAVDALTIGKQASIEIEVRQRFKSCSTSVPNNSHQL